MSILLGLPVILLLAAVWACPVVTLLKQKYVLFVVGLLLVGVAVVVDPDTTSGSAVGGIGVIVWVTAAIRLAPPASRWARQLYGPEKLARARERPAGIATQAVAEQHSRAADPAEQHSRPADPAEGEPPERPGPPPGPLTAAVVVTALGIAVLGVVGAGSLGIIVLGAVVPVLWLVRAGWRRGRTITAAAAVLLAVLAAVVLATLSGASTTGWVVFAVGVLLLAAGLIVLYRDPADGYLRAAVT